MLKNRFLMLIPAFFLIVILFASVPLNFANKIGKGCPVKGCPVAQKKAILSCNPCMYHSVTSQSETDSLAMVGLPATPFVFQPTLSLFMDTVDSSATIVSYPFLEALPLRC
jgi:hypothetical protein